MDLCSMCGHSWHGLTCGYETARLNEQYRYTVSEKCKCPGPFGTTSTES